MLTAINSINAELLDVTALSAQEVDRIHGKRVAKSNGVELVCQGCGRTAHLHKNHHGRRYFQHDPGHGSCILEEIIRRGGGESSEHIHGKWQIIDAIRSLKGWAATPEVHVDGGAVILDVAADYAGESRHAEQGRFAWEVQVSRQTQGEFRYRSDEIERHADRRVRWLTPFADATGDVLAMICDPGVDHIVDRLYATYEPEVPSSPLPVGQVVNSVHRHRPGHRWYQRGDEYGRTWAVAAIDAFDTRRSSTPARGAQAGCPTGAPAAVDEPCTREPLPAWKPPDVHQPYLDTGEHNCAECGAFVLEPWGFNFDPPMCQTCFQKRQDRLLVAR